MKVKCPNCGTTFNTTEYGKTNMNTNKGENTMRKFNIEALTASVNAKISNPQAPADKNHWAVNSQFKDKMICGYIYNPYMVRRWIQAQYMQLMNGYDGNISTGIKEYYTYTYTVEYTIQEISKLAMLYQRDMIAFDERALCFPMEQCKWILEDYFQDVIDYLCSNASRQVWQHELRREKVGRKITVKLPRYGTVYAGRTKEVIRDHQVHYALEPSTSWNNLLQELKDKKEQVSRIYTWEKLDLFAQGMKKIYKLPEDTAKSKAFLDCFIRSGAYYTMKNYIMFSGYSLEGASGRAGVDLLRSDLNKKWPGYYYHRMLKDMLAANAK